MNVDRASTMVRAAALALFAGLPLLFSVITVANVVSANESRQETADQATILEQLSARLNILDPAKTTDTSALYLSGSTSSLAAADLRRRIAASITSANGRLLETRFVEPDASDSDAISLGATFEIVNSGLASFLVGVETGLPIIEVQSLVVRRAGEREVGADEDPSLQIEIVVRAFHRNENS